MQINSSKRADWPTSLRFKMHQVMIDHSWFGEFKGVPRALGEVVTQQLTEMVSAALNLEINDALEEKVRVCLIFF
jgi:hypothetical protein